MITTYTEALEKIFTYEECRDYSLAKMEQAMELLGDPLKNIKVIHVAGTNGKGSTCRMVYAVLREAGYSVGTYNQPHLVDIRERWIVNEQMMSEEEFVEILNRILALPIDLSYFERTTLIAFLYFEKKQVEYACIEVGFGGLLDSTNVVHPVITVITSIGFDHTKILGDTLEEISYQKAGIIKPGIPIVYNHENPWIQKIAQVKGAPIIYAEKLIESNLSGEYQKRNAGIAYEVCKYLLENNPSPKILPHPTPLLGEERVEKQNQLNSPSPLKERGVAGEVGEGSRDIEKIILAGLQKVYHPGRLQWITDNLMIDGAHNIDGHTELKKYIDDVLITPPSHASSTPLEKGRFNKIYYCFSMKHGKVPDMIVNTYGKDKHYILVEGQHELLEEESILEGYLQDREVSYEKLSPEAIFQKSQEDRESLYLVFGSLYMIGEFLAFKK